MVSNDESKIVHSWKKSAVIIPKDWEGGGNWEILGKYKISVILHA